MPLSTPLAKWLMVLVVPGLFVLAPALARAVMPPHIFATTPEDGGVLQSDTVVMEGYTLYQPGENELTITDLATGQAMKWTADVQCQTEGDMERAETEDGAIQSRCTMSVTIRELAPGHEYELSFLETIFSFTYAPGQ